MTTVQTRDSLQRSHLPGLELFNDARVLNTVMTRAQSQVVVVGDAAGLCCFGTCSGIWKSYIDHCISSSSIAPQHFTKEFFEKHVKETARFQKSEHVDATNILTDAILQEMKDEYEQLKTDDEDFPFFNHHKTGESYDGTDGEKDLLELCKKQPAIYKQGKLVRESYNKGYVIPFDDPTKRIHMKGRANLGKTFTGDEVVSQKQRRDEEAKVIGITKPAEAARVLLCFLEDEDHSKKRQIINYDLVKRMMIPIARNAPKICILINKNRRNFIPVCSKIDGSWTVSTFHHLTKSQEQNHIFQLEVIGWKEHCSFPLGKVTAVLPIRRSLDAGLWLLQQEVAPDVSESEDSFLLADIDKEHRKDMSKVFTFTVDPKGARDLDDAISVRDIGDHYELGVHIADVASFVSPGSSLDKYGKQRGITFYCSGKEPRYMLPKDFSTETFSLLSGQDRRVVSLLFKVQKENHTIIGKPTFQLSWINSNNQLSYEEAEKMISKRYKESLRFESVEDSVTVAYCFAKAQRRERLIDWPYAQPDDQRLPGKRKAHLMIEELNVLFNTHTSERLTDFGKTMNYTPLRCQAEPAQEQLKEFKDNCGGLIPLSFHVRHKFDDDKNAVKCETFRILTEVWRAIQSAAAEDDTDNMVDLVAADDIHLLLQPVVEKFRECMNKAYVIRSNSSGRARIGHYSLSVLSYTQASSPIRRYMDIVLQRLLHSYICGRNVVEYRTEQIDDLCNDFDRNLQDAKKFEQKADQMAYAVSMRKQNAPKLVLVASADPDGDSFSVVFPFNKNIVAKALQIMYRDLQLEDLPSYDKEKHCMTLKWKKRIYAVDNLQVQQELKMLPDYGSCIELPMTEWRATVEAIDREDWDQAKWLIMNANTKQLSQTDSSETKTNNSEDHIVDIGLQVQPGDTLQIQMTCKEDRRGNVPALQLVHVNPRFQICVDHVQSPITCFSRSADYPSQHFYKEISDYVRIWKPLCEMESVASAVDESDSIVIENLVVNFKKEHEGTLTGTFSVPLAWVKEWPIEFNFSKCLLCIRKRGLTSSLEDGARVDPREFTWVAHGVTTPVDDLKNSKKGKSEVAFRVNHLPMETVPPCIFQKNTPFTVEVVPLLPSDM